LKLMDFRDHVVMGANRAFNVPDFDFDR
jgi:hypothetical protein